jgi:NAD(P)H-nitrite reductase large subunit
MPQHIVIIGNGISGITCARNIRKQSNNDITVISSETDHFYSRTALMYIYMGHMRYEHTKPYEDWFWKKNRIDLVRDFVTAIDTQGKLIQLQSGASVKYHKLVIATGSVSNKPNFPGVNLKGVQTLYGMPDLEMMNKHTSGIERGVIVGGGLIGIEMAEMLLSKNIHVSFLVRENLFWSNILPVEESSVVTNHINEHHVDLRLSTELKEIKGDSEGKVASVITSNGDEIACQFVGIAVGVTPNIYLVMNSAIETEKGILVNEFFETNLPDIYAIGDCVQHKNPPKGRKAIEQIWYTGRIHGETLAQTICGKRTAYDPGPFFNSAKFFDVEYQTYGTVNAKDAEGEQSFCWQDEKKKIVFRAVYKNQDQTIVGINALGIRLDHNLCDKWLKEKITIDEVLSNLHKLNFDPEFFDKYEKKIIAAYNEQTGKSIKPKRRKLFAIL